MKNISRRRFLKLGAAGATFSVILPSITKCSRTMHRRPNFIIVQLDDLGWDDLSQHGNEILETPHIDAFAKQSVRFDNFYVNPVCAPTRASLLTGRHFLKTGVSHVHGGKDFLNLNETTIAEVFKNAGYATGMWGKWHSGHTDGYFPWERGFDEAYMAKLYQHENCSGVFNGEQVQHSAWADEVITDYAIRFMEKHRDEPFFAYLSYLTCHSPLHAPEEYVRKYQQKGLSENLATLYGMIDHFDFYFQRLLDCIDELGLAENTVILFMSDNGPAIENGKLTDEDRRIRYVNQLRGHKGNIWENGVKSPLFVRWQGHFKPGEVDALADVTDILPTLMDLAGIPLPENSLPLDGRSFRAVLSNPAAELDGEKISFNYAHPAWQPTDAPWTPEGVLDEYRPLTPEMKANLNYHNQVISVRNGRYKLLLNPEVSQSSLVLDDGFALFDIRNDPREEVNLINEKPEIARDLKSRLEQWFTGVKNTDGSFSMPVFLIGDDGAKSSVIMAKGPSRISSDLKNTFNCLTGWENTGALAEYRIRVVTPGSYQVVLHHDSTEPSGAEMELAVNDQTRKVVIQDNQRVEFSRIDLRKGDDTLRISLSKPARANIQYAMDKLISIQLIRQ